MSTISQLTEYSFRRLIRQDAETRLKNQEALKYIIELSQNTRTDISRWDIQAIFGTKTNHFVQDKTEINKRFFAAKESQQIVSNTALVQEAVDRTMLGVKSRVENRKNTLKSNIETYLNRALNYQCNAQNEILNAVKAQNTMDALNSANGIEFDEQFRKIEQAGFFTLKDINGTCIDWITVNPITLKEVNPSAGLNLFIDFGKLIVSLDTNTFKIKVLPHDEPFKEFTDYYHPHVSSDGVICFGDHQNEANYLLVEMRFFEYLELLSQILSNYNPSSPYRALYKYDNDIKTMESEVNEQIIF